ncbi:hypothetical protein BH23GEM6_BH23GEM6_27440 [soil metagenome]
MRRLTGLVDIRTGERLKETGTVKKIGRITYAHRNDPLYLFRTESSIGRRHPRSLHRILLTAALPARPASSSDLHLPVPA